MNEIQKISELINLDSSKESIQQFINIIHQFSISTYERKVNNVENQTNLKILTKLLKKYSKLLIKRYKEDIYLLFLAIIKSISVNLIDFSIDDLYLKDSYLWSIILQSISQVLYKYTSLNHLDYCMETLTMIIQNSENQTLMKWMIHFFFTKNYFNEKMKYFYYSFDTSKEFQRLVFIHKFKDLLFYSNSKNEEILYYTQHIIGTCSINYSKDIDIKYRDQVIELCLRGLNLSSKDLKKESIQLLYLYSQESLFQRSIIENIEVIYKSIIFILSDNDNIVIYFLLKIINEWFDEAKDHFIVTDSVALIIQKILKENILLKYILPLCSSEISYIKKISCEIFSNLSTSLSSTSDDIHYYLEYIKEKVFKPYLKIQMKESLHVVMNLIHYKTLVIPLIESGLIPLIENFDLKVPFNPRKLIEEHKKLELIEYKNSNPFNKISHQTMKTFQ